MKLLFSFLIIFLCGRLHGQGFAVVELFTSQGCSSCPAADKNLGEIIRKAEAEGRPVFGLSFHVDYWNYIGWKDPYSTREFTKRQTSYVRALNTNSTYTPQMIVNGNTEFVGSNVLMAEKVIEEALKQKPLYTITLSEFTITEDEVHFTYSLDKSPSEEILNLAIVERDVENDVLKGENIGKKLHHENVVRSLTTLPLQQHGRVELKTSGINLPKASIIAYAQAKNLHVVAAVSKTLK
jgi:hypothetical protein